MNFQWRFVLLATCLVATPPAFAAIAFDGVAAGDATDHDAILWTRAENGGAVAPLRAEVSTDPAFHGQARIYRGVTDQAADFTLKVDATGLSPNTVYYYRFVNGSAISPVGRFTTPPDGHQAVPVRFGFSGDVDARFRPFPSVDGFGTTAGGTRGLNYFIFLGDTMYETAATGSPATVAATTDGSNAEQALIDYHRKYREVLKGVAAGTGAISDKGQQGIQEMLASTGVYTLLDNHELGNKQLQSGGAPQVAANGANPADFDVNTTGTFNNKSPGFRTLVRAYLDYHPIREVPLSAPKDPRSDGTVRQYFAQQWGRNSVLIRIDDRSYRDIRLPDSDTGIAPDGSLLPHARADNPHRTMLGKTQLAWLKQVLLNAKANGTVWKILVISSPIDTVGGNQDGKSWYGGYRAERNDLLKFIADRKIDHVLFLTTDDHEMRATKLVYAPSPGRKALVPGAMQVVTGPIGGGGPDAITDHSFQNIVSILNNPSTVVDNNPDLIAHGDPPIGLMGFPGLRDVFREGDPKAASQPSSIDFFAPDQNGYTILDIGSDATLTVESYGIPSFKPNSFPQPTEPARLIMRFRIGVRQAGAGAKPAVSTPAVPGPRS
ncbi:MAG TPA: hypothetical protein DDZ81_23560 [Acetobacteraceae bacterium]|jgi:alkaline phosphatase D|nr:hypothetical protein [Acetobacteraceae bacterium]